ncbi:Uncharacterized [Syntrophomonas zehnderi OL-4]|uniref:Uncharacterized n=1 Tax=Syntrophomonas zehnderi OL-4 TaxID=690567 RepID=A0A0E4G961_9FIRM|nr:hypothetical protein [Syntrophomonas zehnderi]CFX06465.1 Uncharacterized [Syntrophomonas zehnderi OL-4]CFX33268.1 Uncharacterized [Syntrophomonas zehnderi OL-4]
MIGFDRPIRPRWIYDSLLLAEPGQKLTELNLPFEEIARELTGKEGKRKVRTVLFRCFLRDPANQIRVREKLWLKELSEQYDLAFMTPIYLFYLIGSTETLITIAEHIFRLYEWGSEINLTFLKLKMVEGAGDRDVVARSAGSFINTLHFFEVITESNKKLMLNKPLTINEEQAAIMLQLWARELRHTPQIDLNQLPSAIFGWFSWPDLRAVARKYNGELWDYQHRMGGEYLVVYS